MLQHQIESYIACREELKELFSLNTETACSTHDLLTTKFPNAISSIDDSCLASLIPSRLESSQLISFVSLNSDASSQLGDQKEDQQDQESDPV